MTRVHSSGEAIAKCATCIARQGGLCGRLSADTLGRVASRARLVDCSADHRLWHEGTDAPSVAIVRRGSVRVQHHSPDGRRQILLIVGTGESVGGDAECRPGCEIETMTEVSLCKFAREDFDQLVEDEPELRNALYNQSFTRLDRTRRLTWILGGLGPNERLRALLLIARQRMPWQLRSDGSGILTMEFPRQDIADLLATTPETVSRLLHQFEDLGLIKILNARQFHLLNLKALANGLEKAVG